MAGEWKETTLSDVSADVTYGYTESASDEKIGPRFLRITDIQNGVVDWNTVPYCPISESNHRKYRLHPGDIVVARTGNSTGENYLYRGNQDAVYASYLIRFRLNQRAADPAFVWYNMRTKRWQEFINSSKTGSAQAGANAKVLGLFPLALPPLAEQKAIAAVLGALDDKIELNRRMNATLEAMARALFQSWFMDFDPVRAKLDGRKPEGLDEATAALFPDSFQESEVGQIPKGWEVSTIGTKLLTVLGGTPSRASPDYWIDGTVPWINSGKTNEFRIIEPSEWITKKALENSATKLLPSRTTVLAITGATLGQVSIIEIECCANQSVVAVLASKQFPTEFIYPWIKTNIQKLLASQTGGAQQHINKGNVEDLVLLCPDHRVVFKYVSTAKSIFDQIAANCFQSRTLATLRDTLLPKLLSGELSVDKIKEGLVA